MEKNFVKLVYFLFCLSTSVIGYEIHKSVFWSIMDFFFATIAWIKWVIYREVTLKIIEQSFDWFIN